MKRVRVEELCDWCWQRDQTESDAKASIAFIVYPGRTVKRYDHCAEHDNPPWADLLDLAHDVQPDEQPAAARPSWRVAQPEPWPCPRCDDKLTTRKGVIGHLGSAHGLDLAAASHEVPPRGGGRFPNSRECPICGYLTSDGPGFGAHVHSAHGEKAWQKIRADDSKAQAAAAKASARSRTAKPPESG